MLEAELLPKVTCGLCRHGARRALHALRENRSADWVAGSTLKSNGSQNTPTFRLPNIVGGTNETTPPTIPPSSRRRCRTPSHVTLRTGAHLSDAAGAADHRVSSRWIGRHDRTPDGTMAFGAAGPDVRHLKPAGRGH